MRSLCHYYKLLINRSPSNLLSIIPQPARNIQTCSTLSTPPLKTRTVAFFKISPNVICEWDKIDINIRSSTSFLGFKNTVPKEIRPSRRLIFGDHNPRGLKFLTRLRMCFSNLREHKFKHIFQDLLIYSVIVALISRRRLIFSIIAIFLYTSANVS